MPRLNTVLSAFAVSAILLSGTTSQAIKAKKSTPQTFNDDHSGEAAAPAQPACPAPPPCPQCPKCPAAGSAEAAGGKVVVEFAGADETDHHRVMNHWSLAAFSSPSLPMGAGGTVLTATFPVVGTRYWLKEGDTFDMGIDVGLGLLVQTLSTSTNAGGATTSTSGQIPSGFWLHGGMPLAIYSGQHYTFEIIPQLDIAYANASATVAGTSNSSSAFHFQVGGQIGPEIHFGFMNIPELSIQPTLGVFLGYTTDGSSSQPTGGASTGETIGQFYFGTQSGTVLGGFAALSAFYYF